MVVPNTWGVEGTDQWYKYWQLRPPPEKDPYHLSNYVDIREKGEDLGDVNNENYGKRFNKVLNEKYGYPSGGPTSSSTSRSSLSDTDTDGWTYFVYFDETVSAEEDGQHGWIISTYDTTNIRGRGCSNDYG